MRAFCAMSQNEKIKNPALILAPAVLSLGLFYASAVAPPLGFVAPAPLYYALVTYGFKAGSGLVTAAGIAALLISGFGHAVFFLVTCGITAGSLADSFVRKDSIEATLLKATLFPFTAGAVIFLLASSANGAEPADVLAAWGREMVSNATASYKNISVGAEAATWLEVNGGWVVNTFVKIFPALSFITAMLMAIINLLVIRAASLRFRLGVHDPSHSFAAWKTPETLVWVVVASGAGALFFNGAIDTVSWNALLVSLAIYTVHGTAIIHAFFAKSNIPILLRAIGYFLIFSYPMLLVAVSALGLADVWADFRGRMK